MKQVSELAQLQAAISAYETEIEVTASFEINTMWEIAYAVTITSGAGGPYTLTKAKGTDGFLFKILPGGSLALKNIILIEAEGNRSDLHNRFIFFPSGTLCLEIGYINVKGNQSQSTLCQAPEYAVHFNGNDLDGPAAKKVPKPQLIQKGGKIHLSDERPIREGYSFICWNLSQDGSGTSYQSGETYGPIASDVNFYAQWLQLPALRYNLTYYGNSSDKVENIPAPLLVSNGQSIVLSNAVPSCMGYIFTGWNTDPIGTGLDYQPGSIVYGVKSDINMYAQWLPLPS